eukprot:14616-Heterococcus_DN1.PRE.5
MIDQSSQCAVCSRSQIYWDGRSLQQAAARINGHMQILQSELTLHAVQCSAQCIFKRPTAAELDNALAKGETEGMKAGPVHQKCNPATETAVTSLYGRPALPS